MRESVIAGFAGLAIVGATAGLAAALLTWEPSIVARATASVAPAARLPAEPAIMAAASVDLPAPDLQASDPQAPDLPADLAGLAPPAAERPAPEPAFAALSDPAGGSFGFRSVLPGAATFAEPGPAPRTPATPALREMVRREMAGRDGTLAPRAVLPPPRPAFGEVRRPAATLAGLQPDGAAAAPGWSEPPSAAVPAWPSLFGSFGDGETRATRPETTLQSGMASWYGPGFHGRRTASGEVFNQNALTAAHRHLPFGTRVRVVDQKTGRSIVVRINDRGPFSHGRVIDLSRASAQAIGMSGTSRVKIVSAE